METEAQTWWLGVGVSSHLFRRGVAPSKGLPGVGVASQRLPPAAGVAPNPGVASHRCTEGVASTSHSDAVFGFLLQQRKRVASLGGAGAPSPFSLPGSSCKHSCLATNAVKNDYTSESTLQ